MKNIRGNPLAFAKGISMAQGEFSKQENIYTVPEGRLFVIEYIGIASSLQAQQELYTAIMPVYDGGLTVYPVNLPGTGPSYNPAMPLRRFGSKRLLLYANDRIDVSAVRGNDKGQAQIEFNVSGRLVERVSNPESPENLRIDR